MTYENQAFRVVFERDYERALVDAVIEHLKTKIRGLRQNRAYHLVSKSVDYIAEVERGRVILIPDARWRRSLYVIEFAA
jgi:hypothetical protein